METTERKPTFRRDAAVRVKPSITAQAGISQVDAPCFSLDILKALNKVLGPR